MFFDEFEFDYEYERRRSEANRLISSVILGGAKPVDEYVGRYVEPKKGRDPLHGLGVCEMAAWMLCPKRATFLRSCPAIEGRGEDEWCSGCQTAGRFAFASGLLGVMWRERMAEEERLRESEFY